MKKRTLQRAFVITIAASATVVAAGCVNETVISNPPFPDCGEDDSCECPATPPAQGSPCPDVGQLCAYQDGSCPIEFSCADDGWERWVTSCNPPPPNDCPNALPVAGSVCHDYGEGYPVGCSYEVATPCGPQNVNAGCTSSPDGLIWEHYGSTTCESPEDACGGYDHPDLCAADAACQWLVPGCADGLGGPPAVEGCYAADDCANGGCGDWGSCETVVHDPCWNDLCDACGMEVNVCIPNEESSDPGG